MSIGAPRVSAKAETFTESVIREMTRLCLAHDGINLSQGFPDFSCPPELKEAAKAAIDADVNQYAITWGAREFRKAIAEKVGRTYPGWDVDPESQICVTCGSTEAMIATMLALVDPGEEVIVFDPVYENYGPDAILSGATPQPRAPARAGLVDRRGGAAGGVLRTVRARSSSTPRTTRPARSSPARSSG